MGVSDACAHARSSFPSTSRPLHRLAFLLPALTYILYLFSNFRMVGFKRPVGVSDIDMTMDGGISSPDASDTNIMSITTVTIPASKRIRASRKYRRHEDLPDVSSTLPATLEPSSSGSTTRDASESTNPNPITDGPPSVNVEEETRPTESNDNIEVHIQDEDTRPAQVRYLRRH